MNLLFIVIPGFFHIQTEWVATMATLKLGVVSATAELYLTTCAPFPSF